MLDLDIRNLKITQETLRKPHQIQSMVNFVSSGNKFDVYRIGPYDMGDLKVETLIEIAQFPDGELYIHNGHHRAVAIYLAGRNTLFGDEYYIKEWDYSDYNDIVFLNDDNTWRGYVTPFDIQTEVRLPDFRAYKDTVKDLYYNQSPDHAIHYIKTHPELYKKKKTLLGLEDLGVSFYLTYRNENNEQTRITTNRRNEFGGAWLHKSSRSTKTIQV